MKLTPQDFLTSLNTCSSNKCTPCTGKIKGKRVFLFKTPEEIKSDKTLSKVADRKVLKMLKRAKDVKNTKGAALLAKRIRGTSSNSRFIRLVQAIRNFFFGLGLHSNRHIATDLVQRFPLPAQGKPSESKKPPQPTPPTAPIAPPPTPPSSPKQAHNHFMQDANPLGDQLCKEYTRLTAMGTEGFFYTTEEGEVKRTAGLMREGIDLAAKYSEHSGEVAGFFPFIGKLLKPIAKKAVPLVINISKQALDSQGVAIALPEGNVPPEKVLKPLEKLAREYHDHLNPLIAFLRRDLGAILRGEAVEQQKGNPLFTKRLSEMKLFLEEPQKVLEWLTQLREEYERLAPSECPDLTLLRSLEKRFTYLASFCLTLKAANAEVQMFYVLEDPNTLSSVGAEALKNFLSGPFYDCFAHFGEKGELPSDLSAAYLKARERIVEADKEITPPDLNHDKLTTKSDPWTEMPSIFHPLLGNPLLPKIEEGFAAAAPNPIDMEAFTQSVIAFLHNHDATNWRHGQELDHIQTRLAKLQEKKSAEDAGHLATFLEGYRYPAKLLEGLDAWVGDTRGLTIERLEQAQKLFEAFAWLEKQEINDKEAVFEVFRENLASKLHPFMERLPALVRALSTTDQYAQALELKRFLEGAFAVLKGEAAPTVEEVQLGELNDRLALFLKSVEELSGNLCFQASQDDVLTLSTVGIFSSPSQEDLTQAGNLLQTHYIDPLKEILRKDTKNEELPLVNHRLGEFITHFEGILNSESYEKLDKTVANTNLESLKVVRIELARRAEAQIKGEKRLDVLMDSLSYLNTKETIKGEDYNFLRQVFMRLQKFEISEETSPRASLEILKEVLRVGPELCKKIAADGKNRATTALYNKAGKRMCSTLTDLQKHLEDETEKSDFPTTSRLYHEVVEGARTAFPDQEESLPKTSALWTALLPLQVFNADAQEPEKFYFCNDVGVLFKEKVNSIMDWRSKPNAGLENATPYLQEKMDQLSEIKAIATKDPMLPTLLHDAHLFAIRFKAILKNHTSSVEKKQLKEQLQKFNEIVHEVSEIWKQGIQSEGDLAKLRPYINYLREHPGVFEKNAFIEMVFEAISQIEDVGEGFSCESPAYAELLSTETTFVDNLQYLLETKLTFSDESQKTALERLEEKVGEEYKKYADCLKAILAEHKKKRRVSLDQPWATLFPQLLEASHLFLTHLQGNEANAAYFNEVSEKLREGNDQLELQDFLVLPVQRLARYPLLLKKIEGRELDAKRAALKTAMEVCNALLPKDESSVDGGENFEREEPEAGSTT